MTLDAHDDIYPPSLAADICARALHEGRCADLLNALSAGGAATLDAHDGHLAIVSADWLSALEAP